MPVAEIACVLFVPFFTLRALEIVRGAHPFPLGCGLRTETLAIRFLRVIGSHGASDTREPGDRRKTMSNNPNNNAQSRNQAEIKKILAEAEKLSAEALKLRADAAKTVLSQ